MEFVVLLSQVDSDFLSYFLLDGLAVMGRGGHKWLRCLRQGHVRFGQPVREASIRSNRLLTIQVP